MKAPVVVLHFTKGAKLSIQIRLIVSYMALGAVLALLAYWYLSMERSSLFFASFPFALALVVVVLLLEIRRLRKKLAHPSEERPENSSE